MNSWVMVRFFRNDGQSFDLDGKDYKIIDISGIGAPRNKVYTKKKAMGDGEVFTGEQVIAENFSVKFNNTNQHLNDIIRKHILSFFNVKYTYTFYVTYFGVTRQGQGKLIKNYAPSLNIYETIDFEMEFIKEEPFWQSKENFGKNIVGSISQYGYPLYDIPNVGLVFDTFSFAKNVFIENDGDVECYFKAVIEAKGTVVNPSLTKNHKYVKILDTMEKGDAYILDFINMSVLKNSHNAISKIDKHSDFTEMQLNKGGNQIVVNADYGDNLLKVTLFFNKLYGGIY